MSRPSHMSRLSCPSRRSFIRAGAGLAAIIAAGRAPAAFTRSMLAARNGLMTGEGKRLKASLFNSAENGVSVGIIQETSYLGKSVSCWCKRYENTDLYVCEFAASPSKGNNRGASALIQGANIILVFQWVAAASFSFSFDSRKWHHYVTNIGTDRKMALFVDGELCCSKTFDHAVNFNAYRFSCGWFSRCIYRNKILTPEEVREEYRLGGKPPKDLDNILCYYSFEKVNGSTIMGEGTNAANLTMSSAVITDDTPWA